MQPRTFSLNANIDFTSTKPAFNEAFIRISETYDDFNKPLINDIFRQLGFLTTKDGAPPALGIFTHNFCNEWTEREWINDSTPAVFEHIKINMKPKISALYDDQKLEQVTEDATKYAGKKSQFFKTFSQALGRRLEALGDKYTLADWSTIGVRERQMIQYDFFSPRNFAGLAH